MLTFGDFRRRDWLQEDRDFGRPVRRIVTRKWIELWPDDNLLELHKDDSGHPAECVSFPDNTVLVAKEKPC
jgi:hypothetical protein